MKTELLEVLTNKDERIYACEKSFYLFWLYYFRHYLKLKSAPFHKGMIGDLKEFKFLLWIMFRESGKTAIARAYVTWCIVYQKKHNIHWIGYELKKAFKNARAVANELQDNPLILEDFGQLYHEDREDLKRKSKPKKIEQFVTTTGVSFSASSTNVSGRGDLESQYRPDLYIFDDFENEKTKKSQVVTKSIVNNIEEIIGGMSADAQCLFLCNYLSKYGSVAHFEANAKKSDQWKARRQPLLLGGQISWPEAFVMTAKEEIEINSERPKGQFVKSVENLKINLGGTVKFNQEMQLIPVSAENAIVREEWYEHGRNHYSKSNLSWSDKKKQFVYEYEGQKFFCNACTAIDPAVSKKESSDDRAICTILTFTKRYQGFNRQYYLIFREIAGIWSLDEFAKKLKHEVDIAQPRVVGCESNGVQEVFRHLFSMYGISSKALNPDGDKVRRMNQNAGDMEFGKVLFPDDGSCDDLKHELFEFTGEDGMPDNRVDAFNYAMSLAKVNASFSISENKEPSGISGGIRTKVL